MTRTLVIAPQWIGDAVMAEPLLATLAERGERLTVAALPWVAPVFGAMPRGRPRSSSCRSRTAASTGRRDAASPRSWRDRFDVAYVLPNSLKSALVPWLARIPERVGYAAEGRSPLLNRRLAAPGGRPPMVAFYGALAGAAFDSDAATASSPRAGPARRDDARGTACSEAATGPSRRAPNTARPSAGRPTHYAALARSLHDADGTPIALLGSPGEAELCAEIAAQAGDACRVLAGRTSLLDAIALIAASRGLASNDSGLMHVAAAFGVPQVAVFGSTSPLHTPPLNERARVLWLKEELQLDCMPCFDRTCRFGHYRCLTSVAPDRVEAALAASGQRQRGDNVARPSLSEGGAGEGATLRLPCASKGSSRLQRELPGVDDRPRRRAGRRPARRLDRDRERVGAGEHLAAQARRRRCRRAARRASAARPASAPPTARASDRRAARPARSAG